MLATYPAVKDWRLRPGTPAAFGGFIQSEKARWAKVVKDSGAKFERAERSLAQAAAS